MLTYGGVRLPIPNADFVERIEAALPLSDLRDFCRRTFPGRLPTLGLPWLARDWVPRLQHVFWPNTASRWTEGWFLVSDNQLGNVNTPGTIRAQAYQGGTLNALPLIVNDGQRPPVSLSLFMLPPIPLAKVLPNTPWVAPGDFLLPLVDVRYFWWTKAAQIAVTAGSTTWNQLFTALASALGITLTVDAIPAAYLTPPVDFATAYEFLPPQLDAACRSVGLKLVANLDGTFRAASAATAQTRLGLNLALPNPTVHAGGGLIDLTNDANSDLAGVLPASVTVLFPTVDANGNPTGGTTVQTVALSSLVPAPLSQYNGAATFNGTELLRCSAGAGPSNGAQIAALASQIAADWYAWQGVKRTHLSLSGAATWTPTGGEERIEWYNGDTILTRIRRPPWNERDETGLLVLNGGSLTVSNLTVTGASTHLGPETFTQIIVPQGSTSVPAGNTATLNTGNNSSNVDLNANSGNATLGGVSFGGSGNVDGLTGWLINNGSSNVTLTSSDTGTLTGSQFQFPTGTSSTTLTPGEAVAYKVTSTGVLILTPPDVDSGGSSSITYGNNYQTSGFGLTGGYQDVANISAITLTPGTYLISYAVLGYFDNSGSAVTGNKIVTRLYDHTNSVQILNSEMVVLTCYNPATTNYQVQKTSSPMIPYILTGNATINLQGKEDGSAPLHGSIGGAGYAFDETYWTWIKIA